MINAHIITLDIDWAPDFILQLVADKLRAKKIKATWFVTHDSLTIQALAASDQFEIGIHPNFFPGSTQGAEPDLVMKYLLGIYPGAVSVRTHGLFQSSNLLKHLVDKYGIKYDSSLFLPNMPHIQPHELYFKDSEALLRFPYFWADYTESNHPYPCFSFTDPRHHVHGMKIYNFHPVHIALNSNGTGHYERMKHSLGEKAASPADIAMHRNNGSSGTGTFFDELLEYISAEEDHGSTLSDVATQWRRECSNKVIR